LKNKGALKFMDYDDVVEIPAMVSSGKVEPIPKKAFSNTHVIDMMRIIKLYEKHAVKAALAGDKAEALKAMAIHPLIGDISTANKCFEEMLMLHKSYLPLFK
jgi:6-phospho-beta-glucosidase